MNEAHLDEGVIFRLTEDDCLDDPVADDAWWPRIGMQDALDRSIVALKMTYRGSEFEVDPALMRSQSTPQLLRLTQHERVAEGRLLRHLVDEQSALVERVTVLEQQVAERPVIKNAVILDLGTLTFALREPLHVSLEIYADEVVATWPEVAVFASGVSEAEALLGLKEEVVILAEDLLLMDDAELGKLLLSQKRALSAAVERRGIS